METLILGAGQFGRRAATFLQKSKGSIAIVDNNKEALDQVTGKTQTFKSEAIEFMQKHLDRYEWVVPAIPVHVALLWLFSEFKDAGRQIEKISVPEQVTVPNPFWHNGTLYASLASHLCPEDCPEPDGYCTVTGEERKEPLYRILGELKVPGFTVNVLQSHQMAPGVGGLLVRELKELREEFKSGKSSRILATSCGCHAVIDAFTIK
ncbi:NAD-binding protein [Dethiobacter alkaliphilus]|uniref:RCK N-terminal domain-containing protein n=1 Tax=Dethiobacter alkaliphilus AHT 1 TaxID=555088 RepID=C0GDJ3_DETAL|nr:NAD-binding protein [Dethiobacter alkaliphilus]EEG78714.1 conserved hypothetical protein [Dethiobacter alkaliphilus AHT 1]